MASPFDSLFGAFEPWLSAFWNRIKELWDKALKWKVAAWGIALTVSGWVWSALHFAGTGFSSAAGYLDAIAVPVLGQPPGYLSSKLSMINTFVPLAECFDMILVYVVLIVTVKCVGLALATIKWFIT